MRTSRLTARIDNNAIADGFQIYLHSFVVTADGEWAVVQQGMNERSGLARRYHWHSRGGARFHRRAAHRHRRRASGHDHESGGSPREAGAERAAGHRARTIRRRRLPSRAPPRRCRRITRCAPANVELKRLGAVLAVAHERELRDFASLLLLEKLGPRTLQSLALVAEVVHGAPSRFADPARFSFAHGGKDGHPFPVPLKTYDESIDCPAERARRGQGSATPTSSMACAARSLRRAVEADLDPKPTSPRSSLTKRRSPRARRPHRLRRQAASSYALF